MTRRTAADSLVGEAEALVGEAEALVGEAEALVGEAEALEEVEALALVMIGLQKRRRGPMGPLAAELMGVLWSAEADPGVCNVTMDVFS
jgi:hypothetical protein